MKLFCVVFTLFLGMMASQAQTAAPAFNFIDYQRTFPRISDALKRKEDTLMKQFKEKQLPWPVKNIYIRSFKYDSRLEVWVRYDNHGAFKLFKTYKVCALAGSLGPKRMQGDYQVPEGFYYINEFNPNSAYHLSLGLNYPNSSDRILADSMLPGGDIYIHGKCVTTGCIPIMDQQIEELYILAAHAKNQGQDFIPVHIFPVHFNNSKSVGYLARYTREFPEYKSLTDQLKLAYDYFERTHKLPLILVGDRGEYVVGNETGEKKPVPVPVAIKKPRRPIKHFDMDALAPVVDKLPVYPGGNDGFQKFLDECSREMAGYLDKDQLKTYVMIEFIIDSEGLPAYAKVLMGGNDDMNDLLQEKFENMPTWKPATRLDKKVAIRLKQSIEVVKN